MSTFIRNLPFMSGRQWTTTPSKPQNTPDRPSPLGPGLQPSSSDVLTTRDTTTSTTDPAPSSSSSSHGSWSALGSVPSSSKRSSSDPSVSLTPAKRSRLSPPTMPDDSLDMLKQVMTLLRENNTKMGELDVRMKELEGGWKGVEDKMDGLMDVLKGQGEAGTEKGFAGLRKDLGIHSGTAPSEIGGDSTAIAKSIAQLGTRLDRFDTLLELPTTISTLVSNAVARALQVASSVPHTVPRLSDAGSSAALPSDTGLVPQQTPEQVGHGIQTGLRPLEHEEQYTDTEELVMESPDAEQSMQDDHSSGNGMARSESGQGPSSQRKSGALNPKGKKVISSRSEDIYTGSQSQAQGSESGTSATERLETPATSHSQDTSTNQIDIAQEDDDHDPSIDSATGTARRRSGRPRKPITPIGALTYTTDGMVKARKRGNGGYKRKNTQSKKPRAQPATFFTNLAKLPATLKMSDGQKRGDGYWPVRGPNNKKGIMQEIVCDTCKGRVHWSCAGLQRDDDPIEEWLCPECVAFIDSGKHKDDIEQSPLDRCLRADCIRRWKQAVKKEEDDDLQYQVEKLVGRRAYARDEVTKERYFEYLVKWVGWGMKDSTWEPRDHIDGYSMIDTFTQEAKALGVKTHHRVALLPEACKAFNPDTGDPETPETDTESEEEEQEIPEAGRGVIGETELEGMNRGEKVLRIEEDEDEDYEKEEGAEEEGEEEFDRVGSKGLEKELRGLQGDEELGSEIAGSSERPESESGRDDLVA